MLVDMCLTCLDFVSSLGKSELEKRKGSNSVVIKATEADEIAQREHEGNDIEEQVEEGDLACGTKWW